MSKSLVCLSADWHFDLHRTYSRPHPDYTTTGLADTVAAWLEMVARAAVEKVKSFIVLGDLFHNRVHVDLPVLYAVVRCIRAAAIVAPVILLAGNHDSYLRDASVTSLSPFSEIPQCTVVSRTTGPVKCCGVATATFMPWMDEPQPPPPADYLFGHILLAEAGHGGHPLSLLSPGLYRRVLLGDVHSPMKLAEGRVQYLGAPLQHSYADAGQWVGWHLLELETGKLSAVENTTSPRFHTTISDAVHGGDRIRLMGADTKDVTALQRQGVLVDAAISQAGKSAQRLTLHGTESDADVLRAYVSAMKPSDAEAIVEVGCKILTVSGVVNARRAVPPMIFRRLVMQDVARFDSADVEFDESGLLAVVGDNGTGKTTVLNAITYALYGMGLSSDFSGDSIIRRGCKEATVGLHLSVGDDEIEVVRTRGKRGERVALHVNGDDMTLGTNPMTDEAIVTAVGRDYQTFVTLDAFGGTDGIRSFFFLPDSERKAVLNRIVGTDRFDPALVRAKAGTQVAGAAISEAETTLARLVGQAEEIEESIEDTEKELKEAKAKARPPVSGLVKLKALAEASKKHAESLRKEQQDYFAETGLQMQAVMAHRAAIQMAKDAVASLERELSRAVVPTKVKVCPVCGAALKDDVAVKLKAEADRIGTELDKAKMQLSLLMREPEPRGPDTRKAAEWGTKCKEADEQARTHTINYATAKAQEETASGLVDSLEARLRDLKSRLAANKKARDAARLKKSRAVVEKGQMDFWVNGFGNTGVRSFLLDGYLADVNERMADYASRLFLAPVDVGIESTTTIKSGEMRNKTSVRLNIVDGAGEVGMASKGQRRRLDVAFLLAVRDVASSRQGGGHRHLLVDELFDGVDDAGVDAMVELIRELSRENPVILVTHDSRLASGADRVLHVASADGVSTISQAGKSKGGGDERRAKKGK